MGQLGLNFAAGLPELFAGKEMVEDVIRVLGETIKLHHALWADGAAEPPRAALNLIPAATLPDKVGIFRTIGITPCKSRSLRAARPAGRGAE